MSTQPNRRQFVTATAGTLFAAALAGCLGSGESNPDGEAGSAQDEFEIEPETTIVLDGYASHWEGVEPAAIEGEENPTLVLSEGESYEMEWINADGIRHDLQIWDDDDEAVNDLISDDVEAEGESATLTFTADEAMTTYVCSYHPVQVGDLVVE